jgi:hypothetical protein
VRCGNISGDTNLSDGPRSDNEFDVSVWAQAQGKFDREPLRKLTARKPSMPEPRIPDLPKSGPTIVVIPDAHAKPGTSQIRFNALGNALAEWKPDYLVDIGDAADMPSLSSHGDVEGERYAEDIAYAIDARERMLAPSRAYNKGRRKSQRIGFTLPGRSHYTLGNHEDRIDRSIADDPARLQGVISTADLRAEEYGFTVHPFGEVVTLCGVSFSHFFASGTMGRPVGGINHAASLVRTQLCSTVCGHAHTFDMAERVRIADGKRIIGISCGCFFDFQMEWTSEQVNQQYRRGILVMRDVVEGSFDIEWWSMHRLMRSFL